MDLELKGNEMARNITREKDIAENKRLGLDERNRIVSETIVNNIKKSRDIFICGLCGSAPNLYMETFKKSFLGKQIQLNFELFETEYRICSLYPYVNWGDIFEYVNKEWYRLTIYPGLLVIDIDNPGMALLSTLRPENFNILRRIVSSRKENKRQTFINLTYNVMRGLGRDRVECEKYFQEFGKPIKEFSGTITGDLRGKTRTTILKCI